MPSRCSSVAWKSWTWTPPSVDVVAEVVGRAVDQTRLDAAAGHPHREAARMVIAAVVGRGQLALRIAGAAELAAPDHQRVVEQAALLQIGDQRGARLIGLAALPLMPRRQVVVLIPALVIELDELHAALGQPARQQAVRRERPRRASHPCRTARTSRRSRPTRPSRRARSPACGTPSRTARCARRPRRRRAAPPRARAARSADRAAAAGSRATRRPDSPRYSTGSLPLRNCTP